MGEFHGIGGGSGGGGGGSRRDTAQAVVFTAPIGVAYVAQADFVDMELWRTVTFVVNVTAAGGATVITAQVEWSHDSVNWSPQYAEDVSGGTITETPGDFVYTLAASTRFNLPLFEAAGPYVRLKLKADAGAPTVAVTVWRGA